MNIPPLAQLAFYIMLAWLIAALAPLVTFEVPVWLIATTAMTGSVFLLPAVLSFVRYKTTVDPRSPEAATTLVTSGVYSFTRNPMYVGMLIIPVSYTHLTLPTKA